MKKRKSLRKAPGKMILFAFASAVAIYSCKKVTEKDYGGMHKPETTPTTRSYGDGMNDEVVHAKTEHLVSVIWNHTVIDWDVVKPVTETEAIDYMEAVLNYTHSNSFVDPLETQTYSQEFTLSTAADGSYTLDGYTTTFNQMSDYIVAIYNSTTATEKNVIAVNLEPVVGATNTVTLSFLLGLNFNGPAYALKSFTSPVNDVYKFDRVSGHCSTGGPRGACTMLEDYGNWNMRWYKTSGGTALRTMGYYSTVGYAYVDITTLPLLTGSNKPASFTPDFLDFQVFAFDTWKGMTNMPCINRAQMNYYLDQIRPLFLSAVAGSVYKEFIYLTVNPKYKSGGSFTSLNAWGWPNNPGLNTTGTTMSNGDIVTRGINNASGRNTYYEHYYIFEYGRYINVQRNGTFRKL